MGAKARVAAQGVVGGAGDLLGYGPTRQRLETRHNRSVHGTDTVVEVAGDVMHGPIIAEGPYCPVHPPMAGDTAPPTAERRDKGDLTWGTWSVVQVTSDWQGGKKQEVITGTGWHRADRIEPLVSRGVLSEGMGKAAGHLALDAERAELIGLKSSFNPVKVDGRAGGFAVASGSIAADRVRYAMGMLGGSNSLMGGTVWLVVVCGVSLNTLEKAWRWMGEEITRQELRGVLRAGLDILARTVYPDDAESVDAVVTTA